VHYESRVLPLGRLLDVLREAEESLAAIDDLSIPTRIVRLPLSWDDEATQLAIAKYMQSVRADATLVSEQISNLSAGSTASRPSMSEAHRVRRKLPGVGTGRRLSGCPGHDAIDPRHRLVTTKYNPARPGRRRTRWGSAAPICASTAWKVPGATSSRPHLPDVEHPPWTKEFRQGTPWLLRFFDQIRFYP